MTENLESLLEQHLPLPHVAAWGVRLSDRSLASHCFREWIPPDRIEQAVSRLALAAENLAQHQLKPLLLCWKFELARIHFAIRSDGACFALFVENVPNGPEDQIRVLLESFLNLSAV